MIYELNDLCFFVKSIKQPATSFDIRNYVTFSCNNTRSGTHLKLVQPLVLNNRHRHFYIYFNRIARLWNSLPPLDIYTRSYNSIVASIKSICGITSLQISTHQTLAHFIFAVLALNAMLLSERFFKLSVEFVEIREVKLDSRSFQSSPKSYLLIHLYMHYCNKICV